MWQENNELQLSGPWIEAKGTEDAEESEFMYWARGQTQTFPSPVVSCYNLSMEPLNMLIHICIIS